MCTLAHKYKNEAGSPYCLISCLIKTPTATGTRFQNNGNADEKKDVASEHEDKTHSSRHHCRTDSHHRALSLPWLQVLSQENSKPLRYFSLGISYCLFFYFSIILMFLLELVLYR